MPHRRSGRGLKQNSKTKMIVDILSLQYTGMYKNRHTYVYICVHFRTQDDKKSSIQTLTMDCPHSNNKIFTKNALSSYALSQELVYSVQPQT
jgi:hypothetical protein